MKKLRRTRRDRIKFTYGMTGLIYHSELFQVHRMRMVSGTFTTLNSQFLDNSIYFKNDHPELNNDEICLVQFTAKEIFEMIRQQEDKAFKEDQEYKCKQIVNVLGLNEVFDCEGK